MELPEVAPIKCSMASLAQARTNASSAWLVARRRLLTMPRSLSVSTGSPQNNPSVSLPLAPSSYLDNPLLSNKATGASVRANGQRPFAPAGSFLLGASIAASDMPVPMKSYSGVGSLAPRTAG